MSRDKQIEEMAKVLCEDCAKDTTPCVLTKSGKMCVAVSGQAEALYNAGYRKKSEGEWNCKWKSTYPQYEPDEYCCSNCGCVENSRRNFCPECGAQMKGYKK